MCSDIDKTHLRSMVMLLKVNFQLTYASLVLEYIVMTSEDSEKGYFRLVIYELVHSLMLFVVQVVLLYTFIANTVCSIVICIFKQFIISCKKKGVQGYACYI